MLDATVDSEVSTQPIVQRTVLDPSHAIHQQPSLLKPLSCSTSQLQPVFPLPIDQCSATMFDECMLGVRAQCFHNKLAERKGYHKEQSGLSTTNGHSVRAVVNVHEVNSERWLHLWFLIRCKLQCAMNNS